MQIKKTVSLLLVLLLIAGTLGIEALAADEGSFAFAVFTEQTAVVEPVYIPYEAGQTIKEALLSSSYRFEGLEQGFISAVDGVADNYSLFYDNAGFDLTVPASSITALCLSPKTDLYSAQMVSLIAAMAEYNARTDGIKLYPSAQKAYKAALNGMRSATAVEAGTLESALTTACTDYDTLMNGPKYPVAFTVTQGEATVSDGLITMTDAYGNVFTAQGSTIEVIPGDYRFCVSDGGRNRSEGDLTVTANGAAVALALPSGTWLNPVHIGIATGEEATYEEAPLADGSGATYYIPDYAGTSGYIRATQGEDVPDANVQLWACYIGTNGANYGDFNVTSRKKSWNSLSSSMLNLLTKDITGRSFEFVARYPVAATEDNVAYDMLQSYSAEILRVPTLMGLNVTGAGTQLPLDFAPATADYAVTVVSDSLSIAAMTYGSYEDGYSVLVNNTPMAEGGSVEVALNESIQNPDGTYSIHITAAHSNGQSKTYHITVTKVAAVPVTLKVPDGTEVELHNAAGALIAPTEGVYHLIPGESYTYISSIGAYHSKASFTAAENLKVNVAEPICTPWLSKLAAASDNQASALNDERIYALDKPFTPEVHDYSLAVSDMNGSFFLWATKSEDAGEVTINSTYTRQSTSASINATPYTVSITSGKATGQNLTNFIVQSARGNTAVVTVQQAADANGVTYYQEYCLHVKRVLHAQDITVAAGETNVILQNDETENTFDRDFTEYTLELPRAVSELTIGVLFAPNAQIEGLYGGYTAWVSKDNATTTLSYQYPDKQYATVSLDTSKENETIVVQMNAPATDAQTTRYTFNVVKLPPMVTSFSVSPANATVNLKEDLSGKRILPDATGRYELLDTYSYSYTVSAPGYLTASGKFTASQENESVSVALTAAPVNSSLNPSISAYWSNFRGNNQNNAVTTAPIPIKSEDAVLYWANKVGDGYGGNAVGSPILVDGYIYTYARSTIFKVDTVNGEIVKTGTMDHASSFSITPPTYAEGMVFVALSNGSIQAFNADTLESLWIYKDPLKGQPNSPITYHAGRIYTGFWNSETKDANFVCLTVTDEDPANPNESKLASWTYTSAGGFYWAGAYACDNFVMVTTDDGASGYLTGHGSVLTFDPVSGVLLDSVQLTGLGDARSSICYDAVTNAYYFTTKGGDFYRVRCDANGDMSGLTSLHLYNGSTNASTPPMSTSTPLVYNGRAYIGVSGTGQFTAYSGHNITVIDLASWSVAYIVPTQGYPQTSGLATTAYGGAVYVYFFDNYTPGKLRMLSDRPGQTQPYEQTVETYFADEQTSSANAGYVLFTPSGAQAQYAICSPIVDEYGTMYFKNDSAHLMALGSTIENLEITALPAKTEYSVGDTFDPAGMRVLAHYSNGTTRDVTGYVTFSNEALTAEDTEFQIRFEHVMYQNLNGEAGVPYTAPTATIQLTVASTVNGDASGDGELSATDAVTGLSWLSSAPSEEQIITMDYNGDGTFNATDIIALLGAIAGIE